MNYKTRVKSIYKKKNKAVFLKGVFYAEAFLDFLYTTPPMIFSGNNA